MTVGMTVLNGGSDLERALGSIVAQDYPNLHILICDDGSSDGSLEYCRSVAASDARVRLIENPTQLGLVGNFNQLIDEAVGAYLVFADQDDRREPTFVSQTVDVLESDRNAVLCHSHTGVVWPGMDGRLYHVNSLDSVDGQRSVLKRYWRFLRHYTDTTIYGLIRLDVLRQTGRWRHGLGSSNRLLFELLLRGSFRQVHEVLYFYTAKGLRYRPSPAAEYARQNPGRTMPTLYVPFLALAAGQTRDILTSPRGLHEKTAIIAILWTHVVMVNLTKALYRSLWKLLRGRVPRRVEQFCSRLVYSSSDLRYVISPEEDPDYYPEGWPLRASSAAN